MSAMLAVRSSAVVERERSTASTAPCPPAAAAALADGYVVSIERAPTGVARRLERVRDACLATTDTGCVLLCATIDNGDAGTQARPRASQQLRRQHDAVEPFVEAAMSSTGD